VGEGEALLDDPLQLCRYPLHNLLTELKFLSAGARSNTAKHSAPPAKPEGCRGHSDRVMLGFSPVLCSTVSRAGQV